MTEDEFPGSVTRTAKVYTACTSRMEIAGEMQHSFFSGGERGMRRRERAENFWSTFRRQMVWGGLSSFSLLIVLFLLLYLNIWSSFCIESYFRNITRGIKVEIVAVTHPPSQGQKYYYPCCNSLPPPQPKTATGRSNPKTIKMRFPLEHICFFFSGRGKGGGMGQSGNR